MKKYKEPTDVQNVVGACQRRRNQGQGGREIERLYHGGLG